MNTAIARSEHTHTLLPTSGILSRNKTGIAHVIKVDVDSHHPLLVCTPNGTTFSLGGLTTRQKQQLPTLLPGLINSLVWFKYDHKNALGEIVGAVFKTLLIEGDSRHRACTAMLKKRLVNTGGV